VAKYNSFKYSDQKYGSSWVTSPAVTWIVQVDWDNDGTLDGANEGQYLIGCNIRRGREEYLNADGSGFEHMRAGKATLVFDNSTGRYDPRNAASALYPNVKPGRRMQIRALDVTDNTQYTLFTGIIDGIEPRGYNDEVTMTCVDYMQWLADQELTFTSELFNTTITGALNHLLTQAQYPGGRLLDDDTQPVWVFAVNKENAASVAHQVADAGLGLFWIDKNGWGRYQERNHTASGTALDQSVIRNDPRISQPWDGVYNSIDVTALRYIKLQPAIVFTLPEAIYLAAGASETVEINYEPSTEVQVKSVTGNTRADSAGTEITFTASAINLGLTGGTITVTNGTGANGYLVDIAIRGRKYSSTEQIFNASDSTSQATYGLRRFRLKSPFLQDRNYANGFAMILKDFLKDDRESLTIQFRGYSTYQYDYDLMAFIEFTSATLGISAVTYQVLGVDHDWVNDNGQDVVTTLYLHRTLNNSTAITSSSLETAPNVPAAPQGYDDPGGDTDTNTATSAITIAVYHNGVLVGNASELDFLDG
jgi:hypothetical protein